jgi:GTP cyclohydrolase II
MSMQRNGSGLLIDNQSIIVERALAEFRAGRPVAIVGDAEQIVVVSAETLDHDLATRLANVAVGPGRLILPMTRLKRLGAERTSAGVIALPTFSMDRIEQLALKIDTRIDAPVAPASAVDLAALELATLSFVLPAVVAAQVEADAISDLIALTPKDLHNYRAAQMHDIKLISRAPVPLEGAKDTEFVIFRGGEGLRDQVAIIVGNPDLSQPVSVRLHSACLTGDLFGSLKCDCGDQLRDTVQWMAANEGGMLLYLDQEGRGNGISNKMRAYKLQSQGFDTYDADEALGFGLDQRRFAFAGEMLKQLGVKRVSLLTNNPVKIAAMRASGLDVVTEQRVIGRPTAENVRYLASKRDRAGHFIDVDAMIARASVKD